jgi:hypothetical protein
VSLEQAPSLHEFLTWTFRQIQLGMDGIHRGRVILPEFELGCSPVRRTSTADENARRRASAYSFHKGR